MQIRVTRREFLDSLAVGAAGLAVGTTAKSYGQILGSNDRLNFAVIGLNGRAYAHLSSLKVNRSSARISHVCDVDSNILKKFADSVQQEMGEAPVAEKDFRKILEQKDVDAITIATPEHWHVPMAIAGLQAGKHVYVEKPCSHNPAEGEMLVQAQQKYRKLVQVGTQQRSSPHTIEIVEKIRGGIMAGPTSPRPGTAMCVSRLAQAKKRRCRRNWIGTCGRAQRHAVPIGTTCIRTTGTGSETTVLAKRSIMERTRSTSAAGRWASTFQNESLRQAADTNSKTTGSFTTRW